MWRNLCRRFAMMMAFALSAQIGSAQTVTVPVRTGEHAEFTRVVVPLPAESLWQFKQTGRRATLSILGQEVNFDTSQSFARIPRTRLSALRPRRGALDLELACDCVIRAAQDLPQLVVLDIQAAVADQGAISRPKWRPNISPDLAVAARAGVSVARALQQSEFSAKTSDALDIDRDTIETPQHPQYATREQPQHQSLTESLGRSISDAVSQGLLRPAIPQVEPQVRSRDEPESDTALIAPSGVSSAAHVAVSNSITRAQAGRQGSIDEASEQTCPAPAMLSPAAWFADPPDLPRLSPVEILTATDKIDESEVRNSAQSLLYWGFGQEARLILGLVESMNQEKRLLVEMSYLVDRDRPPSSEIVDFSECSPSAALWALLAKFPEQPEKEFPMKLAIQGALELPASLRMHIGTHVLANLSSNNNPEDVRILQEALEISRTGMELETEGQIIGQTSQSQLEERSNRTVISEASDIILQLEQAEQLGEPLSDKLKSEALSLLFAARNSEHAAKLTTLLAKSTLRDKDYELGLELIANPGSNLTAEMQARLRSELLLAAAENADDVAFLRLVFSQTLSELPVDPTTNEALAERLISLGFNTSMPTNSVTLENPENDPDPAARPPQPSSVGSGTNEARILSGTGDDNRLIDAVNPLNGIQSGGLSDSLPSVTPDVQPTIRSAGPTLEARPEAPTRGGIPPQIAAPEPLSQSNLDPEDTRVTSTLDTFSSGEDRQPLVTANETTSRPDNASSRATNSNAPSGPEPSRAPTTEGATLAAGFDAVAASSALRERISASLAEPR